MSQRTRTELSQSIVRIIIAGAVLSYSLIYSVYAQNYPNQELVNWILGAFFVYSIAINTVIRFDFGPAYLRRTFAIAIDLSSLSLGFYLAGSSGGIFYPFLLWVIVDNGLRFGVRYLFAATAISVVTMIIAMSNSEYWQQQISLDSGLIIGVIVLPMLYAVILRELEAANKELKNQIDVTAYAATHDSLTKLHNRFIFADRLDQSIHRSTRNKNYSAVLSINIDNFKHINDIFSYAGGDSVLRNVASRLRNALRITDSAGRLGDDEFVVLLSDLTSRCSAWEGTDRIADIFKPPYDVDGKVVAVTASIGISIFPDDADNVEELMHCANTAMLRAKKRGGNSIQSFSYINHQSITEVSER